MYYTFSIYPHIFLIILYRFQTTGNYIHQQIQIVPYHLVLWAITPDALNRRMQKNKVLLDIAEN